jgi:hypothetical protein
MAKNLNNRRASNPFSLNKSIARIFGNFGVSFFGPLVGTGVAETIYNTGLSFEQSIVIAVISSLFATGLSISKEVQHYGYEK